MKVDLTCPLELWEYRLPEPGGDAVTLILYNLEARQIASLQLRATFFTEDGEELFSVTENPMALDAEGKQSFELAVKPPENTTNAEKYKSIAITFEKVWFEDGGVWRRMPEALLTEYEPNDLPQGRALENLRYVAGPDAVGYPSNQGEVWLCVCGRVNADERDTCARCGRSRAYVFLNDSKEAVAQSVEIRELELERKSRRARGEIHEPHQTVVTGRTRSKLTSVIVPLASIIVTIMLFVAIVLVVPEAKYRYAERLLERGDYDAAREMFTSLIDYKDSIEKARECDVSEVALLIDAGDMQSLDDAIATLEEMEYAAGLSERLNEAKYAKATLLYQYGEYEAAINIFGRLSDYRDSADMLKECEYTLASRLMNMGDTDEAAAKFASLGDFRDSASKATECAYRSAKALMDSKKFEAAVDAFAPIMDYADARALYKECAYNAGEAYRESSDYSSAVRWFYLAGDFSDAKDKYMAATYQYASDLRDEGEYILAGSLFALIPDYVDSSEQIGLCTYEPAIELMSQGEYDKAYDLLQAVPDYKDSSDLMNECLYMSAARSMDDGEHEKAATLYAKILNYKDSSDMLTQANYNLAILLEEQGDLVKALAMFRELNGYSDSVARADKIQETIAENLYLAGRYAEAKAEYAKLTDENKARISGYMCDYGVAMGIKDSGDLQGAYDAFAAIPELTQAAEAARQCKYEMAEAAMLTGDLMKAAELFADAGNYSNAKEMHDEVIYDEATKWMTALDYMKAGELFGLIAEYSDSKEKSEECYDLWLKDKLTSAVALAADSDWEAVLELCTDIPILELPESYAKLTELYHAANLNLAKKLIDEGKQLEAYDYAMNAGDSADAEKLRERRIYKLIGEWVTSGGEVFSFLKDYTCAMAGEAGYFNVENYGVMFGESRDSLTLRYTLVTYDDTTISMKDKNGKVIRLSRR